MKGTIRYNAIARSKKAPMAKEPVIFEMLQSKFLPVLKRRAILVRNEIARTNMISKKTGEKRLFKKVEYKFLCEAPFFGSAL